MKLRSLSYSFLWLFIVACGNKGSHPVVRKFTGTGKMGMGDGHWNEASFANPMGIAAGSHGDLYIADSYNNLIRKINSEGTVTTFAGSGEVGSADGKGRAASFFFPTAVAVDRSGNVYVSDTHNNLIRKIDSLGIVTTLAGKIIDNKNQKFDNPAGLAVDDVGNVYVADWGNNVVRKISADGKVTTLAGRIGEPGSKNDTGSSASFYLPWGIALDSANNVYVSDSYNNLIRKISPNGVVTTIAGKKKSGSTNGKDTTASFFHPAGIAIDRQGNLYVADMGNNKIRKLDPGGLVSTLAGNGVRGSLNGNDTLACFHKPCGVAVGNDGSVYVADYLNNMVRKISF